MNAEIVGQVLALSDERDQWQAYALDWARDAYRAGYADGRAAQADEDSRSWGAIPRPRTIEAFTLDELEERRWGPGRRDHFADPRPGDYTGGAL